jgi:hypothetical protein
VSDRDEFEDTEGTEAVGFSHGEFGLVVEALYERHYKAVSEPGNN